MAKQTTRQETKAAVRETLLGGLDLEDESTPDQGGGEPAASEEPGTPAEPVATPDVDTPDAGQPDAAAPAEPATQGFLEKVRELGYEGDSEAEAAEALVSSYRRLTEERQLWAQRLQETEELARFGTEYLQQQRQQKAKARSAT